MVCDASHLRLKTLSCHAVSVPARRGIRSANRRPARHTLFFTKFFSPGCRVRGLDGQQAAALIPSMLLTGFQKDTVRCRAPRRLSEYKIFYHRMDLPASDGGSFVTKIKICYILTNICYIVGRIWAGIPCALPYTCKNNLNQREYADGFQKSSHPHACGSVPLERHRLRRGDLPRGCG